MAADGEKTPTVLVIDDDRGIRSLLAGVLGDAGWDVTEASNGFSGLRRAEQDAPDLILLDLALPEMTGITVLDELQRQPSTRAVPVVAVTGHPDWLVDRLDGLHGVLPKPFELDELVALVARVLARSHRAADPIPPTATRLHGRTGPAVPRTPAPGVTPRA